MRCSNLWVVSLCGVLLSLLTLPARAVIILDSTWAAEGGSEDEPEQGFGAAIELANQPQFASSIAMAANDGEEGWGSCSGTWIGNDGERGYVLTAAHCFADGDDAQSLVYRSTDGEVHEGAELYIHPDFVDEQTTTGFDLAVVVLQTPVELDEPALLYAGSAERGRLLTFMGYGSRGIGSAGQHDDYHDGGSDKAAAQALVDQVQQGPRDADDSGDYLGVFLAREDGSIEHPRQGSRTPHNRLAGLLGSGDSGGPAFIRLDGRWLLAGVNSNGSGSAQYGDSSWFVRVSARRDWIREHAPVARFAK